MFKSKRALIVGAGNAASYLISQINKLSSNNIEIVGIVDDDITKIGQFVHSIPIIGNTEDIEKIVDEKEIEQITIAIPSLSESEYKRILSICLKTGVLLNKMPDLDDIISGRAQKDHLKEVDIEDLLDRDPVVFDTELVSTKINNKTIIITGAGGSIGSEICRQIIGFKPSKIILLGHGENSIYLINKELTKLKTETEIIPLIGDIKDQERINEIFEEYKPDYVYHAAAHKHVPLMEISPKEAIKNNIIGTRNVAMAAIDNDVETFVMISTDKAVNPKSIMGASKRIAEMVVQSFSGRGVTKFTSVRFGNVLGSRGSVVPLFKEQIQNGGPITLTDKRMTRYFMTIPEASQLVIQAGFLAKGGEIFVLDMGNPVKIIDLAKKMLLLQGLTEKDIEIVEVGIRPGEKLYEETLSSSEIMEEQIFPKIFSGKSVDVNYDIIDELIKHYNNYNYSELKKSVMDIAMIGYKKLETE